MKRSWVRSQSVRSVGYDADVATLEIEFRTGVVYRYFMVPARVYRQLREAPSVGTFVNKVIKPSFACERLDHDRASEERRT